MIFTCVTTSGIAVSSVTRCVTIACHIGAIADVGHLLCKATSITDSVRKHHYYRCYDTGLPFIF